jgi:AcrR family transcriptional regulator
MSADLHAIAPSNRRAAEAAARIKRILEVARRMFIEHGYQHTSLDAILKRAGGSKATLRKYFGDKAGLLAAVLGNTAELQSLHALQEVHTAAPAEGLTTFGRAMLGFYLRPDALIVYRSVIAESYRHPKLAAGFYHGGHARIVAALGTLLDRWQQEGQLQSVQPNDDAERFLNMLRSGLHERALLGLESAISATAIDQEVRRCVRIFLHGLARPLSTGR